MPQRITQTYKQLERREAYQQTDIVTLDGSGVPIRTCHPLRENRLNDETGAKCRRVFE